MKTNLGIIFPQDSSAIFTHDSQGSFGGATVQMYQIAKELANHGQFQIFSLVSSIKKINFKDQKSFHFLFTYNNNDNLMVKIAKFHQTIQKNNLKIIIQHGLTLFSCLLALYCKIYKIKFIFMFASDCEAEGYYQKNNQRCPLFKMLLNNTNILITQNKQQQNILKTKFESKSEIIYNGFYINDNSSDKPRQYNLWVGRYDPLNKQPGLYLQIAKMNPDLKFIMICTGQANQDGYNNFYKRAKQFKNLKLIKFVPFVQIDQYFQKAKLLINTSISEGYPQTFIQAGIAKTPIISLNVDPDHFISKHKCGFVNKGNLDLMNKFIVQLNNDHQKWSEYSENIFKYVKINHNIKNNVQRLSHLIDHA